MNRMTVALLSALLCTGALAQASPPLVRLEVKDAPVENGKRLNATFVELEREAGYSIVEAKVLSGGSVSSSMFVVRGLCAVLRARGEQMVQSQPQGAPGQLKLTFPSTAAPEDLQGRGKKIFTLQDCDLLRF